MRPDVAVDIAVDIAWHPSGLDAADVFESHARSLMGPGVVTSGRLCPSCGSDSHGRPWVRHEGRSLHASLSRSGPHLVTAVATPGSTGPVGIDVEVAHIAIRPELVRAPGEDGDLAATWARKEAILKARGTGLTTPMAEVVLSAETWWDLPAPEGYVAALALTSE